MGEKRVSDVPGLSDTANRVRNVLRDKAEFAFLFGSAAAGGR